GSRGALLIEQILAVTRPSMRIDGDGGREEHLLRTAKSGPTRDHVAVFGDVLISDPFSVRRPHRSAITCWPKGQPRSDSTRDIHDPDIGRGPLDSERDSIIGGREVKLLLSNRQTPIFLAYGPQFFTGAVIPAQLRLNVRAAGVGQQTVRRDCEH